MKVLVLGGTRFFGIHLVDELLKQSGIFRSNEHVEERAM